MKKKAITILAIAALLLATIAMPTIAAEEAQMTASVDVSEYISITITDTGDTGINFGTLAPNTTGNLEADSDNETPSITVNVESDSNASVDLQISGTDFTGAGTIPISNAKYSTTYGGATANITTANVTFATDVAPGGSQELWHWLDVPASTTAGSYSSTFTYKAIVHE